MYETEGEVLARIEATRARMGTTIDQIGDRVNPDRVQAEIKARAREQVREAKANVKYKARSAMRDIEHEVSDAGRGIWDTIRENPIPAGLVGVGLAWLVANGVTSDHDDLDYRYRGYTGRVGGYRYGTARPMGPYDDLEYDTYGYDVRDRSVRTAGTSGVYVDYSDDRDLTDEARARMSHAADEVKDHASDMKDRVSAKAHDAADEVRDKASEMKHRAAHEIDELQDRASGAMRDVGYRARRAERRVEHAVQDNPLAAGALAAALGFAAGLMIPETRREHEMFGPARDRMIDNAERTVRKGAEKAKDFAKDTASDAARRAVDEVTGDSDSSSRKSGGMRAGGSSSTSAGKSTSGGTSTGRARSSVTEPGR